MQCVGAKPDGGAGTHTSLASQPPPATPVQSWAGPSDVGGSAEAWPPLGAHEPPAAVMAVSCTLSVPLDMSSSHVPGATKTCSKLPPAQLPNPYARTCAWHCPPIDGAHEQAAQVAGGAEIGPTVPSSSADQNAPHGAARPRPSTTGPVHPVGAAGTQECVAQSASAQSTRPSSSSSAPLEHSSAPHLGHVPPPQSTPVSPPF